MVEFRKSFASALTKLGFIEKSYTETTTRPSVAQPYMSTDTGAKLFMSWQITLMLYVYLLRL